MVDPIIDFNRVEALPYKKTVAMVNNFIINTTQFLNRFAYLCEKKLTDVDRNIQRLEITMNILEQKLASIPGLEGIQGGAPPAQQDAQAAAAPAATTPAAPAAQAPGANIPTPPPPPNAVPAPAVAAPVAAAPASSGVTNQNDPRFSRFFKMLKIGVPAAQIRQKMMFEGVDPDILEYAFSSSFFVCCFYSYFVMTSLTNSSTATTIISNPDGISDFKPENDEDDDDDDDARPSAQPARAERDDEEEDEDEDEDDFDDD